jgi:hypothetical protein
MNANHIGEIGGAMIASGTLAHVFAQVAVTNAPPDFPTAVLAWWPVLVMAGVGAIMWGELRNRVRTLERENSKTSGLPERLAVIETKLDLLLTDRMGGNV